jgi:hypothetical protein
VANVFISYARRDKERVIALTSALENEGLSVWWDSDLTPGRRYRQVIAEQLAAADCVIVVWSAAALESDWVQDEAEEGRQRGVLIPIILEDVRPPAGFRQVQAADLSQWTGSPQHPDFRSLVFAVRSLVQIARATRRNDPPQPGAQLAAEPDTVDPVVVALPPPPPPPPPPIARRLEVPPNPPAPAPPPPPPSPTPPSAVQPASGGIVGMLFSWTWWISSATAMAASLGFILLNVR